ncbi:MAG TPA: hypothetical protein VE553_07680 [Candidatus Binatia bacterium]|jgi:cytoskeletal protein RodZ|nr:hypothetical protein [Candidatus Binatia bacterium]
MVLRKEATHRRSHQSQLNYRKAKKALLLLVEILAVIGLLAGAAQLWQVRQQLQDDLTLAKKLQAAVEGSEQPAGWEGQEALPTDAEAAVDRGAPALDRGAQGDRGESATWTPLWSITPKGGEHDS